ncbi:Uncharacterized protein FKW44_013976, partial [Caligus rogercresseyi]
VIERNTLFGPYLGTFYTVEEYKTKGPESGYAWEILNPSMREVAGCTDPGSDPDPRKNWLAMNMAPLQYKGSIYYRVSKDIQPDVELLTHYGEDYEKFYFSQPSGPERISSRETKGGSPNGVTVEFHFCDVCRVWSCIGGGITLTGAGNLIARSNHVHLVHMKSRSHACNLCSYASYLRHNLDLHFKAVHLDHRDEICPICNKGFGQKINLNRHIKTRRSHACNLCGHAFYSRHGLGFHFKVVHLNHRDEIWWRDDEISL